MASWGQNNVTITKNNLVQNITLITTVLSMIRILSICEPFEKEDICAHYL